MAEPLVSVVVVSYNQAKFIRQMLDSLKSQTYTNWELIVADDASTDDSVAIFKNWLHENKVSAKEIFHAKNTGLATVLNEAIELCTGEYVKLIAADDYLHSECLEKSVRCLEEKGEKYGMVFTDTYCVDEKNQSQTDIADYNKLGNIPSDEFRKELIKGNRIAALTVLMRTSVVKETGKYDSTLIVEDYYRWLKINENYLIAYLPEKLTFYRLHDNNISRTKRDRIERETLTLQMKFDRHGIAKNVINHYFIDNYVLNKGIAQEMLTQYDHYPFGISTLKICMKYKIPAIAFKIIYSISRRTHFKYST